MRRIVEAIMDDNYVSADELFRESMGELVEHFILESKKIIASQMVEEKENDHDKDDPPFDPDDKKSTPWKNPHSKAKNLAREMMKKYKKKEDLKEEQLDELHGKGDLEGIKAHWDKKEDQKRNKLDKYNWAKLRGNKPKDWSDEDSRVMKLADRKSKRASSLIDRRDWKKTQKKQRKQYQKYMK